MLTGCGSDQNTEDDIPPQAPVIVQRTADDAYPQRGIRAEPTLLDRNYWVRMEWYANSETDVIGYVIRRIPEWALPGEGYTVADLHYGEDLSRSQSMHSWIDQGYNQFSQPANLLSPDPETGDSRGYYWTLRAYDEAGNVSAWSDTMYYRLIHNPSNLIVTQMGPQDYLMSWNYTGPEFLSFYKIRVYSAYYGLDSVKWDYRVQRYGSSESITLGEDGHLGFMETDCTYVWQLNAILTQPDSLHKDSIAGAAIYTTFVYQD